MNYKSSSPIRLYDRAGREVTAKALAATAQVTGNGGSAVMTEAPVAAKLPTEQSARSNSSSPITLRDRAGREVTTKTLAAAAAQRKPTPPVIPHPADQTVPLPPLGSRGFPYLSKPDGSWVCQYCHSLPDFVPGKSTWKAQGGFPPPTDFIVMHMNVCPSRKYHPADILRRFGHTTIIGMPAAGCQGQLPKSCMTAVDLKKERFECYYCFKRFRTWDHCKDHILKHMQHYCPELIGLFEPLPEDAIATNHPPGAAPCSIRPKQMVAPPLATMKPCITTTGPVYWNEKQQKYLPGSGNYFCLGCKVQFKKWKPCAQHMQLCCSTVFVGKRQATILAACRVVKP
jgi:hypothetical protein